MVYGIACIHVSKHIDYWYCDVELSSTKTSFWRCAAKQAFQLKVWYSVAIFKIKWLRRLGDTKRLAVACKDETLSFRFDSIRFSLQINDKKNELISVWKPVYYNEIINH